jgi:MFS family permease
MLVSIPSTFIAGQVLDRTRRRHLVLSTALLLSGLLIIFAFQLPSVGAAVAYMLLAGLIGGFGPTTLFTLAPESMPRPEHAGWALGILSVGQNLGMFLGPPAVAAVIAGGQWRAGTLPLLAAAGVGLAASLWLLARQRPPRPAARQAHTPV